jgi:hypothetical protein
MKRLMALRYPVSGVAIQWDFIDLPRTLVHRVRLEALWHFRHRRHVGSIADRTGRSRARSRRHAAPTTAFRCGSRRPAAVVALAYVFINVLLICYRRLMRLSGESASVRGSVRGRQNEKTLGSHHHEEVKAASIRQPGSSP